MKREAHCKHAKETFGKDYNDVHAWLDEFHGNPLYGTKHRKLRHHLAGIEEVREEWGDEAAEVAKQHILDDIQTGEDRNADESWIAKDQQDYTKRGYW